MLYTFLHSSDLLRSSVQAFAFPYTLIRSSFCIAVAAASLQQPGASQLHHKYISHGASLEARSINNHVISTSTPSCDMLVMGQLRTMYMVDGWIGGNLYPRTI
jgi:hypothetical protein